MDNMGLGFAATVTADHYRVDTGVTDVIDMHDFRKSPKACAEDRCIRYHKHCAQGISCTYRLVWPGIVPDGRVIITADDPAALADAEREVSLIVDRDGKTVKLPFTTMTALASSEAPPPCPAGTGFDVCDPP